MDANQIKHELVELDCSAIAFAAICGISKSRMSEILASAPVNGENSKIEAALSEMKALRDEYPGLPINFRDAIRISKLLEDRRLGPGREQRAELGTVLRELKIPFHVFVKLQHQDPVLDLASAYKALNDTDANPAHTQALLKLASQLRDYVRSFPDESWRDVYAIRSTLRRWAEVEREHAQER